MEIKAGEVWLVRRTGIHYMDQVMIDDIRTHGDKTYMRVMSVLDEHGFDQYVELDRDIEFVLKTDESNE